MGGGARAPMFGAGEKEKPGGDGGASDGQNTALFSRPRGYTIYDLSYIAARAVAPPHSGERAREQG